MNLFGMYQSEPLAGSLPSCLYTMPSLRELSASGNALRGHLSNVALGPQLLNVTLSYNRISGSIPSVLQQTSQLRLLDLSYNRILGSVQDMTSFAFGTSSDDEDGGGDANASAALHLVENWLSGHLPAAFSRADEGVDVLSGNMFQCRDSESLPPSDPKATRYACGSDLLESSFDLLACAIGFAVVVVFAHLGRQWYQAKRSCDPDADKKEVDADDSEITLYSVVAVMMGYCRWPSSSGATRAAPEGSIPPLARAQAHMERCADSLTSFRAGCLIIGIIIAGVFLPSFAALKTSQRYISQTFQYGWYLGIPFMAGVVPGVWLSVVWLLTIWASMWFELTYVDRRRSLVVDTPEGVGVPRGRTGYEIAMIYFAFGVNILVSLLTNFLYVYTVMTQSLVTQELATGALVLFKLTWMYGVIVPWLQSMRTNFVVVMWTMICNIVLFPMLATMLVDYSCFRTFFEESNQVTASYSYAVCTTYGLDFSCLRYSEHSSSVAYDAPTFYSYQCFASVVTTYLPTYVVSFAAIGLLWPVIQLVITIVFASGVRRNDLFLMRLAARLMRVEWFPVYFVLPIQGIDDLYTHDAATGTRSETLRSNFYESRYNALNSVLLLVLLLSFGIAYPPFGVLVLCNIVFSTLTYQLSVYFHFVQVRSLSPECQVAWAAIVEGELCLIHKVIFGSRSAVYLFSSLFAAFAISDITFMHHPLLAIGLTVMLVGGTYLANLACKWRRGAVEAAANANLLSWPTGMGDIELVGPSDAGAPGERVDIANPLHNEE